MFLTPNDHARQTRRIRDLTATVTDLLLRQGRLLDRIRELTDQVNEADLRALDRICELTDQVNEADLRAEAAEARVRELEAAIADIHTLATECPQPLPSNFYAGRGVQEWVNEIHAIAESALEARND